MLYNLLNHKPTLKRDSSKRLTNKEAYRATAMRFGKEYFDGHREQGYGGYRYDGRWKPVAQRIVKKYRLEPNDRVLDIGCAKGFLMSDLFDLGMSVTGLDVSDYAKFHSGNMEGLITLGNARQLPFDDRLFHCVVSINTIHNLDLENCKRAILEMRRVARDQEKIFIQVDAYEDRAKFDAWNLTAQTCLRPTEWVDLFKKLNYTGDYYFTMLA